MPLPAIAPHTQTAPTVLPQRNLLRQLTWSLPSGQAVAQAMGIPPLTAADLADIGAVYPPFSHQHPTVVLHPGRVQDRGGGLNLGPVAARIVTETLIGLLRADPTSYLRVYPRFTPFLGTDMPMGPTPDTSITGNRSYTRAHFLYYAGVVHPAPTADRTVRGAVPGPRRNGHGQRRPAGPAPRRPPSCRPGGTTASPNVAVVATTTKEGHSAVQGFRITEVPPVERPEFHDQEPLTGCAITQDRAPAGVTTYWRRHRSVNVTGPRGPGT